MKDLYHKFLGMCAILIASSLLLQLPLSSVFGQVEIGTTTIPTEKRPIAVLIDENANRTYVANYESSSITVIDPTRNESVSQIAVGPAPNSLALLADRGLLFVGHKGNNGSEVSIVSTSDYSVIKSISIGTNEIGLAPNSNTDRVYVGYWNYPDGSIFVIDGLTGGISNEKTIQNASETLVVNPNNGRIYMPNGGEGPTFVIDSSNLEVVDRISTSLDDSAGGLVAVNPSTDTIYLIKGNTDGSSNEELSVPSGTLFVIDGMTNTITSNTTLISPAGLAVDQIRNRVYVTNEWNNSLYVVDGSTGAVLDEIEVGERPVGVAVNENNGTIFVTNSRSDTVSVIRNAAIIPEVSHSFKLLHSLNEQEYILEGNATQGIKVNSFSIVPRTGLAISLDATESGKLQLLFPRWMIDDITHATRTFSDVSLDAEIKELSSNSTHQIVELTIPEGTDGVSIGAGHVAPEFSGMHVSIILATVVSFVIIWRARLSGFLIRY